ncbi:MAG: type VI secretion system tip protein VgrG, partial [Rubrivivax sp.]|nr:type VI secretion system tip protein VgrG [Rubrivivax sp.]
QFKLARHPRADQNRQYLLTRTEISARNNGAESAAEPGELRCTLRAIPATQLFSPARVTPKPFVQGPQTAVVVGPEGEEIYTDKYGRVKVQFHWDRYGQKNEKSSCWTRVSTPWAGKSFGFVQIPRIGQEVVVDFLEGDPDQPLITGRVYNAEQMPPWELPANATKSGLRTRSSKGGAYSNANEISFEDKAGAELLSIHAELDMNSHVERDDGTSVGRDQSIGVKRDQTMTIERHRSVKVHENENLSVGLAQTLSVGTDQSLKVVGNRQIQVDGYQQTQVTGDISSSTSGKRFDTTSGLEYRNVGGNWICESGGTAALSAAGNIVFKAPTISLVAGHLDMNITGANSVVHTSPNGPYSIMANKFVVLSNTDASILAAGKINQTSVENNVTVMGSNNSGYMGMASDVNLGLARSTFLGLSMDTFMGVNISNTLAVQLENTLAAKIECAVGPHVELNTMKVYSPGGGAAGGPAALSAGWQAVSAVAATYSILAGVLSALKGFDEIANQYKEARDELREQADEADKAGHPGLAARLRRLASGEDLGSSAPENTSQDRAGHTVTPSPGGSTGSGGS